MKMDKIALIVSGITLVCAMGESHGRLQTESKLERRIDKIESEPKPVIPVIKDWALRSEIMKSCYVGGKTDEEEANKRQET